MCGLKHLVTRVYRLGVIVTPSRVCGLKLLTDNQDVYGIKVTPSRVCGLKRTLAVEDDLSALVTPSRVCGLKLAEHLGHCAKRRSHTLAGVWIEASAPTPPERGQGCHTLAGVWIEAGRWPAYRVRRSSHPRGCVD